mgnify:CR=1 FL=1
MPKGRMLKYEMQSHLYKLKTELDKENSVMAECKGLANEYLNKVLDKLEEFRY